MSYLCKDGSCYQRTILYSNKIQTLSYPAHHMPLLSPFPQHNSSYQPPATPHLIPEEGPGSNPCLSEENQNQQPSQAPAQPPPQGAPQEPGGYMLTPNAPVLFGSSYSPFEKPPPYAC